MSLSDLASLGSFASGVAVLASLGFLYFQMRQMTEQVRQSERNQQAVTRSVRTSRIVEIMMETADPSLADAIFKGRIGATDITDTEIHQFFAYSNARFFNAQDTFQQYKQGHLDNNILENLVEGLRGSMSHLGTRAFFQSHRGTFSGEFVKFVQDIAAGTPLAPAGDPAAQWRSDVAALKAKG